MDKGSSLVVLVLIKAAGQAFAMTSPALHPYVSHVVGIFKAVFVMHWIPLDEKGMFTAGIGFLDVLIAGTLETM